MAEISLLPDDPVAIDRLSAVAILQRNGWTLERIGAALGWSRTTTKRRARELRKIGEFLGKSSD